MPTRFKGNSRETRALNVYITLLRAAGSLGRTGEEVFSSFGLSGGQFGTLETLLHLGPLCQKELGEKLLSTEGNVTVIVQNLEKRGLIERVRNTDDQRFVTVHLTDEGKKLIRKAFAAFLKELVENLEHLSDADLEAISAKSKKLGLGLKKRKAAS
ncbi:MAG: MarR family transcriptional regulator [Leptospirales bacterium]|nr:MarR family transcriptional regulator [Leptospirales bacterium]